MRDEERVEKVLETLEELIHLNSSMPIIVEWRKDKKALNSLGVKGEILRLNRGMTIFNICESIAARYKEAIILTDWDHRGGQLCKLLEEGLEANGVRYNIDLRSKLAMLCKKEIKDVEGLESYLDRRKSVLRTRKPSKKNKSKKLK